jgi:hypothetical protein
MSPERITPTGVTVRVDGVVVARGRHVNSGLFRDGVVTVVDSDSRETVSFPVEGADVVSTVTVGWLFGHEVLITAGSSTRYVLSGYLWEDTAPPLGVVQVADTGSYSLSTDDLDDVVAIRSVTDTLVVDLAESSLAASVRSASEGHGDRELASLAPVPVPDAESRPGVQQADGPVVPLTNETVRTWVHGVGTVGRRDVELLAERGQRAWVASRRPLSREDRQVNGRFSDGVGSRYVAWVTQDAVSSRFLLRREWSGADGVPLLQGRYARVAGLWRTLPTYGLSHLGPDGQRLLRPGVTVVGGTFPLPLDGEDYAWALTAGGRAVPDGDVTDIVSVRTTAQAAGIEVELLRPWDPMTDGDVLLVGGEGAPGEPVLLSDGFTFRPRPASGGGWAAQVRRDHLEDVRTMVVDGL